MLRLNKKCVKENSSSFNSKSFSDSNDILAETSTVNTFIEISCSSDSSVLYEATTNDKALQIINELKENTNYSIHLSKNLSVLKNIIGEKYPTDFGHYPAIIEEDYIKIFIIKYGSLMKTDLILLLMIREIIDHFQDLTIILNLKEVLMLKENGYAILLK